MLGGSAQELLVASSAFNEAVALFLNFPSGDK
ncbi:hypothetical protein SAMN06314019_10229 [Epsilonproteobacteria bacterium SCGC AD-311-C15]|jgi:hypothetical protein|nr:hypothetical protein SAMN06314019_10229 [Epsilonproteobacteria bacterium SCGC AD-311-C15]